MHSHGAFQIHAILPYSLHALFFLSAYRPTVHTEVLIDSLLNNNEHGNPPMQLSLGTTPSVICALVAYHTEKYVLPGLKGTESNV